MGDVGNCQDGRQGGPAIQWARAANDGRVRAIQIGLISRGLGCSTQKEINKSQRPEILAKIGLKKAWIMAHVVDGGCSSYV